MNSIIKMVAKIAVSMVFFTISLEALEVKKGWSIVGFPEPISVGGDSRAIPRR